MVRYNFMRQLKSELQQILSIINLGLVGMPEIQLLKAEGKNDNASVIATTFPELDVDNPISSHGTYAVVLTPADDKPYFG